MKEKDKKLVALLIGIIILALFVNSLGHKETTGVKLKVSLYDKDGNYLSTLKTNKLGTLSIISKPQGIPVKDTQIKIDSTIVAGNTGDAVKINITDITATNSPGINVYGPAISNYTKQFQLLPGGQNTQSSSWITTSSIQLGDITFTITINGFYYDAEGIKKTFSQQGSVVINILQEEQINFRTLNSALSNAVTTDDEIAFSTTCDGSNLIRKKEFSSSSGGSPCDTYMVNQGWNKSFSITSGITSITRASAVATQNFALWQRGTDYSVCGNSGSGYVYMIFRDNAITISDFPYYTGSKENKCSATPPTQTCGNNIKEGTEVCDGTDLNNQTCQSKGFTGGTLSCSNCLFNTSSCTSPTATCSDGIQNQDETGIDCGGVCSACSPPVSNVKFRTSSPLYTSALSPDNWIAYSSSCGGTLTGYGYDSKGNILSGTPNANPCSSVYGTALITNIPHDASLHLITGGTGVISIHLDSGTGKYFLCENNAGADDLGYQRYSTSRANNAITSPTSTNDPSKEVSC